MKILLVDDEPDVELLIKQQFRKQIKENKVYFIFASNGLEALEKLKENPDVEIVLSDINMPVMDGLALLENISKMKSHLKTVVISAYGDMPNIRRAMNAGAIDFITKPIDFEDLDKTLKKTQETIRFIKTSMQEHDALMKIQEDLQIAHLIQTHLLPTSDPFKENSPIEIAGHMTPALDVGGDFYDYFLISPTKLAIIIADVSGKGIHAALFQTMTRAVFRCYAPKVSSVSECMSEVNRFLHNESEVMFITAFYAVYDLEKEVLDFCSAGHNPPFLIQHGKVSLLSISKRNNIALAVLPDTEYKSGSIPFCENDFLFLYTDGVTDANNPQENLYSIERLIQFVNNNRDKSPSEFVERLVNDLNTFISGAKQFDDITLVCMKVKPKKEIYG